MNKRFALALNAALALLLVYLFFSGFDVDSIASTLSNVRLEWLLPAIALYYALQLTTALRLKWLSDSVGAPVQLREVFWAHLAGMLFSDYTPGRSGYAYFVVKARGWGLKARQGVRVFGVSLAADFFTRGVFAAAAIYLLFESIESLAFAAVFLLAGSSLALWALSGRRAMVSRLLPKLPAFGKKLSVFYEDVFSKRIPLRLVYWNVGVSFVGAFIRGLEWMCLAAALGHPFALNELYLFAAFNSVITALSFVPLSVAGLGLQEGAGTLFFSVALAVSAPFAAALMVLVRLVEAACNLAGIRRIIF